MHQEEPFEHLAMCREPIKENRRVGVSPIQLGKAILAVNHLDLQRRGHLTQASEIILRAVDLPPCKPLGKVVENRLMLTGARTGSIADGPVSERDGSGSGKPAWCDDCRITVDASDKDSGESCATCLRLDVGCVLDRGRIECAGNCTPRRPERLAILLGVRGEESPPSSGLHPLAGLIDDPPDRAAADSGLAGDLIKGHLLIAQSNDLSFQRAATCDELSQPIGRLCGFAWGRFWRDKIELDLA